MVIAQLFFGKDSVDFPLNLTKQSVVPAKQVSTAGYSLDDHGSAYKESRWAGSIVREYSSNPIAIPDIDNRKST